jgi:hypothetical protein
VGRESEPLLESKKNGSSFPAGQARSGLLFDPPKGRAIVGLNPVAFFLLQSRQSTGERSSRYKALLRIVHIRFTPLLEGNGDQKKQHDATNQ